MGNKLISIILLFFVLELNCEAQFYKEWYASRTRKIDSLGKLELYKPPKVSKFTQNHGTINFTRDNLVEVYSGYYHFTMTDSIGNILFFTNGLRIYDRLGRVMPNGDSINLSVNRYNPNSNRYINTWQYLDTLIGANDYIYGCQAINYPGKPMHYLLIYSCIDPDSFSIDGILINLAEIDISGNNGYGSVIRKEETIIREKNISNPTLVKHANGRDWWLITSLCNSNLFYFYLINHENITLINKVKEGPEINGWSWVYLNRVSPDGELLAKIDQCGFVSIYRLDRCEGKITYLYTVYVPIQIDNCDPLETFNCSSGACISGIEFSPDSRILYVSRGYEQLFQLDLTSRRLLKIYNRIGTNFLQFSQRLNDGSIYVDNPFYNASNLHVLRRPDLKGLACDFDIGAVDMPADVQFRLQQNPDIYMGSVKGTVCDSL